MIYAINYDLKRPGQNYEALHDAIKSCGIWWHYLDSTWLLGTLLDANGIRSKLEPHVDMNELVLVIGVSSVPRSGGISSLGSSIQALTGQTPIRRASKNCLHTGERPHISLGDCCET